MKTNVKVGDVVTITGKMGSYNGAKQVAAGATAVIEAAGSTEEPEVPAGPAEVTIPEANAAADGTEIIVKGTVKEINTAWSEQYGNITVTIEDGEGNTLYVYRMKTNVKVGDVIQITGKMGSYNGAKQVAAGATAEILEAAPVEVSLAEAVTLADGTKVIVVGTVKEINTAWSEQYGNITVTIEDANGDTLYIYRMKTNVNVGDEVKITGKMGSYNGAKQIAAGATAIVYVPVNAEDFNFVPAN
jgi:DNA/RNA endonuclease YhcR with UshA esterase domain